MVTTNISRRGSAQTLSSTLFLVAGVLLVGHAALWGVRVFTALSPPTGVFAAPGHLVAVVALVTLVPVLADRTPSLAWAAGTVAAISATGWVAITAEQFGEVAGLLPPRTSALPDVFYVAVLVATIIAYVLFSVTSHRGEFDSRILRPLLLAPGVLLVAVVASPFLVGPSPLAGFGMGSGLALAMLAIGYRLRTTTTTDRGPPADGLAMG